MNIILFLIIGALAGFLAGKILRGGGFGLWGNLVVGIVGAFVGGFLFDVIGVDTGGGIIASLFTAVVGAVVLLWLITFVKRA